jgi:hypothetical protein
MAKNSNEAAKDESTRDPLIKTVSELAAMSELEKQAFRLAGGTVTNDPE